MYTKALIFAAVVACAIATDSAPKGDERVKKDVLLGTLPYAYAALPPAYTAVHSPYAVPSPYLYDDGKYYPGKYEKAYIAAPAVHVPATYAAAIPAVSAYSAAVPAVHQTYQAAVPAVSGIHVPSYHVAGYPYVKSYVY